MARSRSVCPPGSASALRPRPPSILSYHPVVSVGPAATNHARRAVSISESLLPEFDQEMTAPRRLLERVPSDRGPWKPHPKSFPLGHLAQLVSRMPGWITRTIRDTRIDLATSPGYSFQPTDALLEQFDRNV